MKRTILLFEIRAEPSISRSFCSTSAYINHCGIDNIQQKAEQAAMRRVIAVKSQAGHGHIFPPKMNHIRHAFAPKLHMPQGQAWKSRNGK